MISHVGVQLLGGTLGGTAQQWLAWGAAPETWGYSAYSDYSHHCSHAPASSGLGAQQRGCGPRVPAMGLLLGARCTHPHLRCSGRLAPPGPRVIVWTSPQVGDFAILLRAGFDRWSVAKLQLSTALGGLLGACFAICAQSPKGVGTGVGVVAVRRGALAEGHGRPDPGIRAQLCPGPPRGMGGGRYTWPPSPPQPVRAPPPATEETVAWILPFTSGGFLYIALVNVLPDLLEEDDPW